CEFSEFIVKGVVFRQHRLLDADRETAIPIYSVKATVSFAHVQQPVHCRTVAGAAKIANSALRLQPKPTAINLGKQINFPLDRESSNSQNHNDNPNRSIQ